MAILEVKDLVSGYSEVMILNGVSIHCADNEIVSIIGPNGAGKSTLMKSIFGLIPVKQGSVAFDGRSITGMRPNQLVKLGMSYVPQEKNVFPSLTVEENLQMGAFIRNDDLTGSIDRVFELFPFIADKRKSVSGTLSGGGRQMLALGRALMLEPRLLLLDEPSAGLAPLVRDEIFEKVMEIRQSGVAILMVEQNAKKALGMSDRGYVLVMGKNRYEDTGEALLANPEVGRLYLGGA
ncbi:MAG: ABC transporter ATP-binding protein [Desulfobacterales bacterium]|jgi:ABC-type branched-subunit amino acid transport system ATPase component